MSSYNRSSVNIPVNPSLTGPLATSSSAKTNRISRVRPASELGEQWKRTSSSTSSNDSGWKTSSGKQNIESWKMSGKPRHAQLQHTVDDSSASRRQSATPTMTSINSPWQPKPLPQEPSPAVNEPFNLVYPTDAPPFHLNTPAQPPAFIHPNVIAASYPPSQFYPSNDIMYQAGNPEYPPAMINATVPCPPLIDSNYQYTQDYPPYPMHAPPSLQHEQVMYPSSESVDHPIAPPFTAQPVPSTSTERPVPTEDSKADKKKKKEKPEKKIRQITVQSINAEHRVWINVLPSETGLSLAEKIHVIATFRTRKIVSITTASGRKIPLDNRPVFGSWIDMESFVDGERWTVEWRENDRGVVDKFFSKVIQAGGGKRKDHVVKEKD